jgi:hypothetical protein
MQVRRRPQRIEKKLAANYAKTREATEGLALMNADIVNSLIRRRNYELTNQRVNGDYEEFAAFIKVFGSRRRGD